MNRTAAHADTAQAPCKPALVRTAAFKVASGLSALGIALSLAVVAGIGDVTPAEAAPAATGSSQSQVCTAEQAHKAMEAGKLKGFIDGPGKVKIVNNHESCSFQVGTANYTIPEKGPDGKNCAFPCIEEQTLYKFNDFVIAPKSTRNVTLQMPDCATQLDVYYGEHIKSFKGGVRYWNTGWQGKDRKLEPDKAEYYKENMPCKGENTQIPLAPAFALPLAGVLGYAGSRFFRRPAQ